jgi:hydrogenase/urease accessory protein HupE
MIKPCRLTLLLLLAAPLAARAHTLPVTGVVIHSGPHSTSIAVTVHLPLLAGADPATTIPPRLHIRLDGTLFQPTHIEIQRDSQNDTVTWSAEDDRPARTIAVDSPVFPDHPEDTTVVLIYQQDRSGPNGGQDGLTGRMILTPAHPSAVSGESLFTVLRRFIVMGVLHILSGPDHILFVLGLILAGGTVRQLLGLVTAFTLAHSITLSLTALGIASLSPRIVEPVIAFSIIVVGLENLLRHGADYRLRVGLAFGFGFFHGFGFAGALTEVGLPQQAIGWSLAAFNLGVEIGQGCILLTVLPILHLIARSSKRASQLTTRYLSIAIAIAGAIWLIERI